MESQTTPGIFAIFQLLSTDEKRDKRPYWSLSQMQHAVTMTYLKPFNSDNIDIIFVMIDTILKLVEMLLSCELRSFDMYSVWIILLMEFFA